MSFIVLGDKHITNMSTNGRLKGRERGGGREGEGEEEE